jgi:hypothetical protein
VTTPGSEMYVCGDSGYELGPSATLSYCPRVIVISNVAVVMAIIAQTQCVTWVDFIFVPNNF